MGGGCSGWVEIEVGWVEFGVVGFEVGLGWVGCKPIGVGRGRVGFRSGWGGWVETVWGGLSRGGWG